MPISETASIWFGPTRPLRAVAAGFPPCSPSAVTVERSRGRRTRVDGLVAAVYDRVRCGGRGLLDLGGGELVAVALEEVVCGVY